MIVQDENGHSDFEAIRYAMANAPHRLVFFAFDAPFLNGEDLHDAPLEERRLCLRSVLHQSFDERARASPQIQFSDHGVGGGPAFFVGSEAMALEGIVSQTSR